MQLGPHASLRPLGNRRNAVTPDGPKPGGSWFHVQPDDKLSKGAATAGCDA